jgi:hypothetical protein
MAERWGEEAPDQARVLLGAEQVTQAFDEVWGMNLERAVATALEKSEEVLLKRAQDCLSVECARHRTITRSRIRESERRSSSWSICDGEARG